MKDYGFYAGKKVDDIFKTAIVLAEEEGKKLRVAAAINNNDYEEKLSDIIRNNTEEVLKGMSIAAKEYNAEAGIVYLRREDSELAEKIVEAGKTQGLEVTVEVEEVVDVHIKRTDEYVNAICHFETFLLLATGKKEILLAVKEDGKTGEMKAYPFGVKVSEVLKDADTENVKMIFFGTKMYDKSVLELEITEDFQPADGVIKLIKTPACAVVETEKALTNLRAHSCGKCTFCREGGIQMQAIMREFSGGKGKPEDIQMLEEISGAMPFSTLCSIGKSGGDSVVGVLKYFNEEIEDHVKRKKCPSDICQAFMNIYIDPMKCSGCEECVEVCPVDCIEGDDGFIHMIDELDCIKCGKCIEVCPEDAILKATGRLPKLPKKLTKVGKFKRS
jgi:NADH:ubiquinone oxidoreductase subunit F (NADH-binding)/NAD-dependent dihydropyrimidine dehydrogenase PreA subunit